MDHCFCCCNLDLDKRLELSGPNRPADTMVDNCYLTSENEPMMDLCAINSEDLLRLTNSQTLEYKETFIDIVQQDLNQIEDHQATAIPDHWCKYPNLEKVQSDYDFNIDFHPDSQNSLYSALLDKVYIKIHSVMNVMVSFKRPVQPSNLILRAMIVFSSPDDMHREVIRCQNHIVPSEKNQHVPDPHILKCYHPSAQYVGEKGKQLFGERLSLVVPLDIKTTDERGFCSETIRLEFLCQSSCATGINRKAAAIVFTLESFNFDILGKRVMNFKVCSCPKRDMQKDSENIVPRKREAQDDIAPKGKRPVKMMKAPSPATQVKTEPPASVSPVAHINQTPTTTTPPVQQQQQPPPLTTLQNEEPVTLTITMPNRQSMVHLLRCGFNECTGLMATQNPNQHFVKYAQKFQRLLEIFSEP